MEKELTKREKEAQNIALAFQTLYYSDLMTDKQSESIKAKINKKYKQELFPEK